MLGTILSAGAIAAAAGLLAFEGQYRRREGNRLELTQGQWQLDRQPCRVHLSGEIELINRTARLEIMVPELTARTQLFSKGRLDGVTVRTRVTPLHKDAEARNDDYWFAYIVKTRGRTSLRIDIEIEGGSEALDQLRSAWIRLDYVTYGPGGRIPRQHHIIHPLAFPAIAPAEAWRPGEGSERLPVPTHLLTALDDPIAVVERYVRPHYQPGDVLTLGETPLAIMQGRYRHPSNIRPGWVARRVCYYFLPTSSLATACGLQSLVDEVGPWRVFLAFLGGSLLRLVGHRGGFYELAGQQARLVDDVTGTLPPYDQFIVLGPEDPLAAVNRIERETGIPCAIVDVNDLRAVKVLAASNGVSEAFLTRALLDNPAGNGDEQTPLVLLRPRG